MAETVCPSCRRNHSSSRPPTECELCGEGACRGCVQFLADDALSFLQDRPPGLEHNRYCPQCYREQVEPELAKYEEQLEKARQVYFFFAGRKPIPILEKALEDVSVDDCVDRDETILRLAFQAVQQGYNTIWGAVVESRKLRDNGYQKSSWSGTGRPALVDPIRLERIEADSD